MGNFRALITVKISFLNLIFIVIIYDPEFTDTEYRNSLCQVKKRSLAPLPFKVRAQYYWKAALKETQSLVNFRQHGQEQAQ